MSLFDTAAFKITEEGLDAAWYKQQVISHNISNVSTPNYKAKTVDFGLILKEVSGCKYHDNMSCEHDSTLQQPSKDAVWVKTTYETNTNQILNGNNVDIEKEAQALSDVQYQYSTMIDYLNSQYAMIRAALGR